MFDAFCKIDPIPGESTDDKHKDWIELLSFEDGIREPARQVTFTKPAGRECMRLISAFVCGKLIPAMTVETKVGAQVVRYTYLGLRVLNVIPGPNLYNFVLSYSHKTPGTWSRV